MQTAITLLKKQITKLDAPDFDLEAWKIGAQAILTQAFGRFDLKTITIRDLKIDYSGTMLRDSTANYTPMETARKKGREILELAIDELNLRPVVSDAKLHELMTGDDRKALEKYVKSLGKEALAKAVLELTRKMEIE
jgi:hypothetical protein